MLIDAHCHLDFPAFDQDRLRVIEAAKAVGVEHFVVPSTFFSRWPAVIALAKRTDISICLGLHPYFVAHHQNEHLAALEQQIVQHEGVIAVGECGIDARFPQTLAQQWHYFDAQLGIAKRHQLPVVVHCVKANDHVGQRLRQLALPSGGLIHAFAGSLEQAKAFLRLGFILGIGGNVTFERAKRLRRVVSELPDDGFVLETDSPDMPLCGFQGARNEPKHVADVCQVVAALRGQRVQEVAALSTANAARLFRLRINEAV